jgi:hypothetical protein
MILDSIIQFERRPRAGRRHVASALHGNPVGPTEVCPGAFGVNATSSGQAFIADSMPNPARNPVAIGFLLPKPGPVPVQDFSADGRIVETVAKSDMPARPRSVSWNFGQGVQSGLYFYCRVVARGRSIIMGKIVRID